ncbi:hypothetical protein ALI22I_33740 [Saccharothrix sp. ALI-22-I]|uniref:hypothetical protein n=1 Tax=Saccharothrix sp. ALI-22-I TaxID=1933778 RepID=UPI00097BD4FC|nr:hypothetical protein [Saccharothrix sp. ALI-22-I]ONI83467.1 hypothetical protein ALI22I_33740 [Saccharothrix sp. ALI-22-I]
MKITPRKNEVAAVVQLLESDGYDSAEALAKDVIKRVAELFADREFYAFVHRFGPGQLQIAWGPFTSDAEVVKFANKAKLGGEAMSLKLCSTGAFLARLGKNQIAPSERCATCNHPHGAHEHPTFGGRCAVRGCACKQDVK